MIFNFSYFEKGEIIVAGITTQFVYHSNCGGQFNSVTFAHEQW